MLPPDHKQDLTAEEIEMFQNFGQIGWQYFYEQLINTKNQGLRNHITYLYRIKNINDLINQYEGAEKGQQKFELLKS